MDISKKLNALMDSQCISATALARKSGVSQTMISAILRGERNPTVATLSMLCDALGIPLADFFSEPISPNKIPADLTSAIEDMSSEEHEALLKLIKAMKSN